MGNKERFSENYEKYEKPISGETYIRKQMGPIPSHFFEAIDERRMQELVVAVEIAAYEDYKEG